MGDLNVKVGKGRVGNHIGPYGLEERSDRGETLTLFIAEHNTEHIQTVVYLEMDDNKQ